MSNPRSLLKTHSRGSVEVSPRVVAGLVAKACADCHGVVAMSARGLRDGLAQLLNRDNAERGIELHAREEGLAIDLFVVVEYGVRVVEVAHNLMNAVAQSLEQHLGVRVVEVNVNVQGVHRESGDDGAR